LAQLKNWWSLEGVSTFEEVEAEHVVAEPSLHMLKATAFRSAWKVVVEPLRPILHILNETLHQIAAQHIVDVMLQTQ